MGPVQKKKTDNVADQGPTSLFLFTPSSPVRRLTNWFVNSPVFEWTIIITIIANCVVMSLDDKLPVHDKTVLSLQMEDLEPIFMIIFTIEMCTKILALGFILHKNSYMRNLWNIMDFIVVVSGFLPLILPAGLEGSINLNTLRTFRVLRPLKLVSGVPSLQVVMSSIGKAIGPLVNIALLLLFAVIIFAIVGLEFYAGALNTTCYSLDDLNTIVTEGEGGAPCFPGQEKKAPMGSYTCNIQKSVCLEKWEGPNSGITSFDNIGLAMLTVFQCVSMEGWTPILYWTNDAIGSAYNWIFFIPLIVVGSFFMLNLVLGVLSGEFAKEKDRVESRAGFLLLKEEQKLEREMNGYMNWICKAEDLVLAEERTSEYDKKRIVEARRKAAEGKRKQKTEEEELAGATSEFWARIRRARICIRRMCKQQWWFWLVIILVFLNTCTVAVEHYNQPQWLTIFLYYAEFLFLGAFVFEMCIRLYALGPFIYFSSAFNRFDCVVITGSIFEVLWVNLQPRAGSFGLSGLRALRLLRVFKVTKYWSPLRNLVIALMNALSSIMSLLFLLFLFIFIFALLGMQLFGGSFNFPDETPTSNFNTIINALLTVFQVLTEEDWNNVMYTAIVSQGGRHNGGIIYSIYFVMLTLLGNYCLLNVFLAIACDSLDQAAELTAAEEAEKERQEEEQERQRLREQQELKAIGADGQLGDELRGDEEEGGEPPLPDMDDEDQVRPILPYSSLFILTSTNPFRVGLHWFVTKPFFDGFIMIVILLSSASLAAEDPVEEHHPRNLLLQYFDYVFTAIFAIECLLKILDLGACAHPGSYLRDIWNVLDSLVVSCALISFYFQGTPMGQKLKSVKLLRVLRPLKMVNRVPALKAVFDCVVTSLKNVFNILIVYMLFLLIFAMVGVQLFNGKFFYCSDASKGNAEECQGEYFVFGEHGETSPTVERRVWDIKAFNYDNCGAAIITLFAVQTSEGWVDVLQNSMSSTFEDEGPFPWFSTEMAIFYIVYFVVFPFFFVNIFVALVIVTFNELGEAELTDDIDKNQKSCIDFVIMAKPMEVYIPEETSGCLYQIWRLVTSPPFENFIMLLIVLNTVLLMMKYHGAPLHYTDILSDCNLVFTTLFTVECVMKLSSFGYKAYFSDAWNTFDFITVAGSIVDATNIVNVGFLRLFRAARLIKLLRKSVSIRILLFTFVQSIKALPYVMMLMVMLFFIYAIIGMQIFGNIGLDANTAIERHNNFRHIGQAFMMLFRCSTGEAWPDIMMACVAGRPCDSRALQVNKTTGEIVPKTCGSSMTYVYFISFIFLCSFIMLNIVVAVIMDSFDYLTRDSSILGSHHLGEFITVWCEYDPLGEGKIHYTDMFALLKQIDPPLGFGSKCPDLLAYKRLVRMNMPVDNEGKVHFNTTLFALVRVNLQIFMRSTDEMDQADQELRTTIGRSWPFTKRDGKLDLLVPPSSETGPNKLTVGKIFGGMLILENWKITKFGSTPVTKKNLPNGDAGLNPTKSSLEKSCSRKSDPTTPTAGGGTATKSSGTNTKSKGKNSKLKNKRDDMVEKYLNTLEPPPLPPSNSLGGHGYGKPRAPDPPLDDEPLYANVDMEFEQHPPGMEIPSRFLQHSNQSRAGDQRERFRRGASVDRHREYQTPQYYDDTYYAQTREEQDRRVTVKHIGSSEFRPNGKLERQWSNPNLRPRPGQQAQQQQQGQACPRQLPQTPKQPPGTIIVIENVLPPEATSGGKNNVVIAGAPNPPGVSGSGVSAVPNTSHRKLPGAATLPAVPQTAVRSGIGGVVNTAKANQGRSRSLPRPRTNPVMERPQGTGRRLPPTPHHPHQNPLPLAPTKILPSRKRELPKPNSLELGRGREQGFNFASNVKNFCSKSMNFPRLEGSPSHSSSLASIEQLHKRLPSIPPAPGSGRFRSYRNLLKNS
ncbi:voltage-dependent calcium channel type A subunit alpha-1 isoform X2 [Lepeophtheirus salmonis]|uniref:voltage-dependent calcium channel type A subunit alpha-1 isoform X2 n=1 Tax=Lepeophtheirus salmonis TaxID=72036 RepID=UPI001AEB3B54|nr:voltage-dependent calcium channel type A subunit alpha-1-like isoform X2 [Lepeophtheirus salmonis]